jgi:hypothetical protein
MVSSKSVRYLAMSNIFASLRFQYLLGETAVCEIVRDCCDSIWNCVKATELPKKSEEYWVNIANDFLSKDAIPQLYWHCGWKTQSNKNANWKWISVL